jgi:hypothetical protein
MARSWNPAPCQICLISHNPLPQHHSIQQRPQTQLLSLIADLPIQSHLAIILRYKPTLRIVQRQAQKTFLTPMVVLHIQTTPIQLYIVTSWLSILTPYQTPHMILAHTLLWTFLSRLLPAWSLSFSKARLLLSRHYNKSTSQWVWVKM